jgi:glycosyltransferase involved in cell wall biosynthesis
LFVDPLNPREIADTVLNVLRDEKLRRSLIEQGLKEATRFSWDKAAQKTLKIFETVCHSSPNSPSAAHIPDNLPLRS